MSMCHLLRFSSSHRHVEVCNVKACQMQALPVIELTDEKSIIFICDLTRKAIVAR